MDWLLRPPIQGSDEPGYLLLGNGPLYDVVDLIGRASSTSVALTSVERDIARVGTAVNRGYRKLKGKLECASLYVSME